tara:strand:+ start:184 stop:414 length:231 start_codon:yes stop_codon:yes gene_type:complete
MVAITEKHFFKLCECYGNFISDVDNMGILFIILYGGGISTELRDIDTRRGSARTIKSVVRTVIKKTIIVCIASIII